MQRVAPCPTFLSRWVKSIMTWSRRQQFVFLAAVCLFLFLVIFWLYVWIRTGATGDSIGVVLGDFVVGFSVAQYEDLNYEHRYHGYPREFVSIFSRQRLATIGEGETHDLWILHITIAPSEQWKPIELRGTDNGPTDAKEIDK